MIDKIKAIIAEDQTILRQLLCKSLQSLNVFENIQEAKHGQQLIEILTVNVVDLILLDIEMPVMNGVEALKIVRKEYPSTKVIMLTSNSDPKMALSCLQMGAKAYLPKDVGISLLEDTIYRVLKNGEAAALSKQITDINSQEIMNELIRRYDLSQRELEILYWICKGKSNKMISAALEIAVSTIEKHKTNIYKKTKTNCLAEIISFGKVNRVA